MSSIAHNWIGDSASVNDLNNIEQVPKSLRVLEPEKNLQINFYPKAFGHWNCVNDSVFIYIYLQMIYQKICTDSSAQNLNLWEVF